MQRIITVAKAGSVGDQDIEDVFIDMTGAVPDMPTLDAMATFYETQAQALAQTLGEHLPGGVLSRLTALLLLRQAGYLRVPLPKTEA